MQSFRFRAGQFVVKCAGRLDYQALLGKLVRHIPLPSPREILLGEDQDWA